MTIIIDGTAGITFPVTAGSASAVQASSGRVLQVVSTVYNTEFSTSSSSYADTGITATITPSSSSSKVLIFYSVGYRIQDSNIGSLQLVRGSTSILNAQRTAQVTHASYASVSYLDSPATTSATTYKIQASRDAGSAFLICWNSQQPSTLTLMEIAA